MDETIEKMNVVVTDIADVLTTNPDEETKKAIREILRLLTADRARLADKMRRPEPFRACVNLLPPVCIM